MVVALYHSGTLPLTWSTWLHMVPLSCPIPYPGKVFCIFGSGVILLACVLHCSAVLCIIWSWTLFVLVRALLMSFLKSLIFIHLRYDASREFDVKLTCIVSGWVNMLATGFVQLTNCYGSCEGAFIPLSQWCIIPPIFTFINSPLFPQNL